MDGNSQEQYINTQFRGIKVTSKEEYIITYNRIKIYSNYFTVYINSNILKDFPMMR